MSRRSGIRPTPALVVAVVALVAAMSGAAVALPGKNQVKGNDIAKGAVKAKSIAKGAVGSKQIKGKSIRGNRLKDGAIRHKQLREGAVTSAKLLDAAVTTAKILDDAITGEKIAGAAITAAKIANGAITAAKIADGAITGQQVAPNGLDSSNISDYKSAGTEPVTAVDGADFATARGAAAPQELFSKGQLSIYGKCFRDTSTDTVYAHVYVATTADGAILDADDVLDGDPDFLNVATAEDDRELENNAVAAANAASTSEGEFLAMSPDGTRIVGQVGIAAKNGTLAGGNGLYGAGNVCLFSAEVAG
jgi:hypothetical protein